MTTDTLAAFDAVTTPLDGELVIEASAGTGKTWSLTRIVLRLVVEKGMPIGRILLVTFTKAATAELAARMKELLTAALSAVRGETDAGEFAPFLAAWAAQGVTAETAAKRLSASVDNYDDAAVYTIHSFCQRTLRDCVFSQGGDFDVTPGDTTPWLKQTVDEFLRREVQAAESDEVKRRLLAGEWESILRKLAVLPTQKSPDLRLKSDVVATKKKKGATDEDEAVPIALQAALKRFMAEAPKRFAGLKHEAGIEGFDDMLTVMEAALANDDFASVVRGRFDAVLIDEFQDTDSLQYSIFRRLFMTVPGVPATLVFVGDPKQSIYSFRSSDVAVYNAAVKDVGHTLQLTANWRSHPTLVAAVNAFFAETAERRPFLTEAIRFSPVEGKAAKAPLMKDGVPLPVFEIWKTDAAGRCTSAGASDTMEAEWAAEDMAQLLAGGTTLDDRSLKPSDIAILVRDRRAAEPVVEALARRGLRVLWRGNRDDVYTHEAARDMLAVLRAVESPKDRSLLATAQATRLFGRSLEAIRAGLSERIEDSLLLKTLAERFQKGGAAALFAELAAARRVQERLLPTRDGMRYLADMAQMTEILHERGRTHSTLSGLIRRVEAEREEPVGDESDRTPRVESDEDLINVQTLHSSKGLEYPVVYLVGAAKPPKATKSAVFHVHDATQDYWCVDVDAMKDEEVGDCARETLQEAVRLLYVGMTRASRRLVLPMFFTEGKKGNATSYRCANPTVMALWGNVGIRKSTEATAQADAVLENLQVRLAELPPELVRVREMNRDEAVPVTEVAAAADETRLVAAPGRAYYPTVKLSSFSGIMRSRTETPALAGAEGAPDENDEAETVPEDDVETTVKPDAPAFDPARLRGPDVGTFLHEIMEKADFLTEEGRADLIERMIRKYASIFPEENRDDWEAVWRTYIETMMRAVLSAPLTKGLTLSEISREKRASEWPFTMSTGTGGCPDTTALARLLARWPKYDVGRLDPVRLQGYLTGTADLLFEWNDRFYLVDWKSNVAGNGHPEDYTEKAMDAVMREHGYRLQYLIYLTAFCRFLAQRFGETFEAAYDRVGGAFYVFLRGAGEGSPTQGIVRDRPPVELLSALNDFFARGEVR